MERFKHFNRLPSPHPKAPVCRLCFEPIEYNFTIQLCDECKKAVIKDKEFTDYINSEIKF